VHNTVSHSRVDRPDMASLRNTEQADVATCDVLCIRIAVMAISAPPNCDTFGKCSAIQSNPSNPINQDDSSRIKSNREFESRIESRT